MGKRGALGKARGAGGELNIDGVVELQLPRQFNQPFLVTIVAQNGNVGEIVHARRDVVAHADHDMQVGQFF